MSEGIRRKPYPARSSSYVFSLAVGVPPSRAVPKDCVARVAPGCPLVVRRVAYLLRRRAVGGPSGAVCSGWRDPGAFGCDAGTRACAFCGDCSVGRCASFRVPYRTTRVRCPVRGNGGARPGPAPADASLRPGKTTDILSVLQRSNHGAGRRATAGRGRPAPVLEEREKIPSGTPKTPEADSYAPVPASTYPPDMVLCRPTVLSPHLP